MSEPASFDLLAALFAGLLSGALGGLWYSGALLGPAWMAALGKREERSRSRWCRDRRQHLLLPRSGCRRRVLGHRLWHQYRTGWSRPRRIARFRHRRHDDAVGQPLLGLGMEALLHPAQLPSHLPHSNGCDLRRLALVDPDRPERGLVRASRARCALLLAFAIALGACAPKDRRPGLWIAGQPQDNAPADWSACSKEPEIYVETRTWYGLPHSVTTVCATDGEALYVPSVYFEGGNYPDARLWNRNVARDARVRVAIGGLIYELEAHLVQEAAERDRAARAFAAKYPFWQQMLEMPAAERPNFVIFRLDPRRQRR